MKKFSLLVILTTILLVSITNATTTINAPAVDANGNGVVTTISATATAGTGKVRTDISNALVAQDTELSIRHAMTATTTLLKLNPDNYDVNIDIIANAEQIDGPSGGMALALVIYSELAKQNLPNPLRTDMIVTGTINDKGEIGPVGGVEEKLQAAAKNKLKLVLIAKGQSTIDAFDYVIYANEISNGQMQVIEVKNLTEAVTYAFTPNALTFPNAPQTAIKTLQLKTIDTTQKTTFLKQIAQDDLKRAVDNLAKVQQKLQNDTKQNQRLKANIRAINTSITTATKAIDQGYYYSAANTAFLININLETILLQDTSPTQFNALLKETQQTINEFQTTKPNTNNFETVSAAQMRYTWAKNKLQIVKQAIQQEPNAAPNEYLEEIIIAKNWINAANKMAQSTQAKQTGDELNENNIRPYALTLLKQAIETNTTNEEFQDHIDTAKIAIAQNNYIAATYDLQYVMAFNKADNEIEQNQTQAAKNANIPIQNKYVNSNSIWAELYYTNALYNAQLSAQNQDDYSPNALRLIYLAQNFEQNKNQILLEAQNPRPTPIFTIPETNTTQNQTTDAIQIRVPNNSKEITASIQVTPKQELNAAQQFGLALIAIALILLTALIIKAKTTPQDTDSKIRKLDDALIEGRISEKTYKQLMQKYAPAKKTKDDKNTKKTKKKLRSKTKKT